MSRNGVFSHRVIGRKTQPEGSGSGRERPRSGRFRRAQTYSLAMAARRSLPPTLDPNALFHFFRCEAFSPTRPAMLR